MTWDPDFGCPVHPGEPQPCVICEMPPGGEREEEKSGDQDLAEDDDNDID